MRTRSFFSVLILVAIPLLGAKGGCGGEVSLGDDACPTSACGGMPELACWDGSSPFTGKCLAKSDGACGWEPRKCPDAPTTECTPCEIPAIACADGTSPYTGKCFKDAAGACIAEKKGCGGDTDAGPAPCTECAIPEIACADGSSPYSGKCVHNDAGACVAEYLGCKSDCTPEMCGPVPPVAKCPDGSGPTMDCKRAADGACRWNVAPCPATACEKVEALPRSCTNKAECTFGLHQYNCCGSLRAMGYTKSALSSFDENEKACVASYPGCGCASMPTIDDSGKTGSTFEVDCIGGTCTTFAK